MQNRPQFSIITCTLNSEKYISNNINSVENQTLKDYEHIFIDGKSTDNTLEIINKYKKRNPKIVKLLKTNPKGVSHAMNRGIAISSGKYIIHLHSDDYFYDKNVLRDVKNFITKESSPDWVYGKIQTVEENDSKVGVFPNIFIFQKIRPWLLRLINYVPHQATFINYQVFNKFGLFDEKLKSMMDNDYWNRISQKTNGVFFDRIISNYTLRSGAISSSIQNKHANAQELNKVLKKHNNFPQYILARTVNKIISIINKTYR